MYLKGRDGTENCMQERGREGEMKETLLEDWEKVFQISWEINFGQNLWKG